MARITVSDELLEQMNQLKRLVKEIVGEEFSDEDFFNLVFEFGLEQVFGDIVWMDEETLWDALMLVFRKHPKTVCDTLKGALKLSKEFIKKERLGEKWSDYIG